MQNLAWVSPELVVAPEMMLFLKFILFYIFM
jgi:hypothetical protein